VLLAYQKHLHQPFSQVAHYQLQFFTTVFIYTTANNCDTSPCLSPCSQNSVLRLQQACQHRNSSQYSRPLQCPEIPE